MPVSGKPRLPTPVYHRWTQANERMEGWRTLFPFSGHDNILQRCLSLDRVFGKRTRVASESKRHGLTTTPAAAGCHQALSCENSSSSGDKGNQSVNMQIIYK